MIKDYFRFSFESIKKRRLRSYLTLIGIFIGIAAVVSLISLGQGLQTAISEQFQQVGADKIFVLPGSGIGPPGSTATKLTDHDRDIVRKTSGVQEVANVVVKFANVKFNHKTKLLGVLGVPTESKEMQVVFESINNLKIVEGKNLRPGDNNKVIIGSTLYQDDTLFGKEVNVRDRIEIEGQIFEVIGKRDKVGNPADDGLVYISLDSAEALFNSTNKYDRLFVKVEKGADIDKVAANIKESLRRDRGEKKDEEDFQVITFNSILGILNSIFSIVQAVLVGIASISLLVGGIGIMNTMYMSVLERTKEIGVMKAIGAKNSDVMKIFLIESGFYGLIGGAMGILIGWGIAKSAELIAGHFLGSGLLRAEVSPTLIISVLAFSFFIGIVSGVAPAYRASKLRPVDALRYE